MLVGPVLLGSVSDSKPEKLCIQHVHMQCMYMHTKCNSSFKEKSNLLKLVDIAQHGYYFSGLTAIKICPVVQVVVHVHFIKYADINNILW